MHLLSLIENVASDTPEVSVKECEGTVLLRGFLNKARPSPITPPQTWQRRYFVLTENVLIYYKRSVRAVLGVRAVLHAAASGYHVAELLRAREHVSHCGDTGAW